MSEADIQSLYVRYGYFLFRRCLTYVADEATAQDAVQEVFVRVLQSAAAFRGQADPKTWLCRISDHHCIDLLRRRRTRGQSTGGRVDDSEGHDDGDPISDRLVRNDDPESMLTARRLMAALDPGARRMAMLYFVDELTQDELAAELGLSRKTIGKHLKKLGVWARTLMGEAKQAV
jgi:RNA polymerase sigma-70 factor (ECF subfamily)